MRQLVYLILLFFSCVLFAQNLDMKYRPCVGVNCGGYGDPVNFVANDVTSDYGRRDCSDCSTKWHKGIDLSIPGNSSDSDLGYAILAVEDGSISKIRGSKTLKYIHINSDLGPIDDDLGFGYAHIFTSEISNEVSLGAFKLVPMDFPYEDEYAIILPGGLTAIGAYPGTVNGFIQVQTKVDKDDYVAPLGNSGGYPSHLHLHRFIDIAKADNDGSLDGTGGRLNTRDPLEVISFPEPEYEVSIPNIALKYGEEESSIVVRAKMAGESKAEYGRHPRGVMSVDHVKLEIKNEYEDEDAFMLIEGTSLRSEISQGGRSSPITHIYPFGITEPSQTGSESKTGIDANAYSLSSGKGYPYDDYYFSDFNTRKKSRTQELAKVNKDAKYKDGVYNLRGTITTITDKVYPKPENREDRQIIIDNFLPYISEVIIKDGNESGETIYRGVWEWDGFSLTLDSKTLKRAESTDNLWVRIITSESMSQLDAGIGGLSGTPQTNGKNGLDWIFTFPPIASSGDNILWIEGLDKAGNQLNTNPAALPVRNSSSSWSGTYNLGTDQNHVFESGTGCVVQSGGNQVNGAAPQSLLATGCTSDVNGCIYAGILVDQTIVATGERLEFSSVSENSDYTYTWDFGSNASAEATDASGPISVVFHTEGLVEVGLAVCDVNDNCACTTETINVTDNGVDPFSVSFSAPTWSINTYDEVTLFTPVVSGHSGTLSYDWDFGQGVASVDDYSSPTPTVSYRTSGQKTVKLTVTDDFQSVTKTINSFFNVGQIGGGFDVQFSSFSCIPLSLGYYQFSVSLFGDELFKDYTYYWDFGDGQLETTTNRDYINHQYNDFGQYTVSVKVCEDNGPCKFEFKEMGLI